MQIRILAVGTKMPAWVEQGCHEYAKRMPRELAVEIQEIPMAKRHKNADAAQLQRQEGAQLLGQVTPRDHVVALEVNGKAWTTRQLADQIERWQLMGGNVALLIGGPDGLSEECRQRANQQWSLSPLTLPHPLVRVILAEQIYRAWSVVKGHPYHRA